MSKITRRPDWRPRLLDYVRSVARAGFRPGRHDCALFAAGAVKAMTDVDLAADWPAYGTLAEGQRHLAARGYADHVAVAAAFFDEVPPLFAQVGDIAVVEGEIDLSLGIVQGAAIYLLARGGLTAVPLTQAQRAFRV